MKRSLRTLIDDVEKRGRTLSLLLFLTFFLQLGQAQPCSSLTGVPRNACEGSVTNAFIIGTISNTFTFNVLSGTAVINHAPNSPIVVISWIAPGEVVFEMIETPLVGTCTPDTFTIQVGPSFAPQVICNDTVNVSLDEFCSGLVTPDMVLEGNNYVYNDFEVIIKDRITKVPIPTSPIVNKAHIGKFYEVTVRHICTGTSCWGILRIEDKLPPAIQCKNFIVDCNADIRPEVLPNGFPKANPAAPDPIPNPRKPGQYSSSSSLYDACGSTTLLYVDRTVHVQCPPPAPYIDTVFREWTAMDASGNVAICTDTILVQTGTLESVECPRNFDDIDTTALLCDANDSLDVNGNPHPFVTGYPTMVSCRNLNFAYTDFKIRTCEGTYKIIREWFIVDWCTGTDTTCVQVIKVVDKEGPVAIPPADQTISTSTSSCSGWTTIKLPKITKECSSVYWEVLVKRGVQVEDSSSFESTNVGVIKLTDSTYHINDLPVGLSYIFFIGTDGCGNISVYFSSVFVEEKTKPIAVCDLQTVVTLTDDGSAKVYATTFDDGSHDNCKMGKMEVRRMNAGNCPPPIVSDDSTFREFVEFCCNDILTNPNIVVLRVYDAAGNYNECMVEITVVDKKPPVVECLPNITVSCLYDYNNLNNFGYYRRAQNQRNFIIINDTGNITLNQPHNWGLDGLVSEDCNLHIDSTIVFQINKCDTGRITRSYTFRDDFNNSVKCTQIIRVINFAPYNGSAIVFANDTTLEGCRASVDPSITGYPKWPTNISCAELIATYEDQVFNIVENVCYKILRKWTVVDWCNLNANNGKGRWTDIQVIKITNKKAPDFTSSCDNRLPVDVQSSDCSGYIELIATATDDCTNPRDLIWTYSIDLGNNGTIDFNGNRNDASGNYPVGTHKISWTVEDQCGNKSFCTYLFTLRDGKKPTPYCRTGIITVIMPSNGQVTIWAADLNINSTDNCTPGNKLRFSFSLNINDASRTYRCDQIPDGISQSFDIRVYVWDENGNQDYCDTKVIIQDGIGNACPDNFTGGTGSFVAIGGNIFNESNQQVEETKVTVHGNMPSMPKYHMTGSNGQYVFASLPINENYSVLAEKEDDPLNGVTTHDIVLIQKHILGIANLNSAYKVIAADVNNTATVTAKDISDLRKLILGITTELPANKSWVFVNAHQKFIDNNNPWPIDDRYNINNMTENQLENNFIAVKLGDVSGNAKTNQLNNASERERLVRNLQIKDKLVDRYERVEVMVALSDIKEITGLQLEFNFDANKLKFEDIQRGALDINESNVNVQAISEGKLRISWDAVKGVTPSQYLFKLIFTGLQKSSLSDALALNPNSIKPEVYDVGNNVFDLRLNYFDSKDQEVKGFYLFQNQPNPFSQKTTISFQLSQDEEAILKVYDVNGKILRQIQKYYTAGFHTIEINKSDLNSSGILYYSLETKSTQSIRKMILLE
ncbi:MAG: T9SS type A sorting domain-containing protein [Bacteroidota bacterium]|nr:T9SS type A sorting domain-containing protein [Bacteroidota bacterium]